MSYEDETEADFIKEKEIEEEIDLESYDEDIDTEKRELGEDSDE